MNDAWVELEWLEGASARQRDWGSYLRAKYPELREYRDADFRVGTICGRDGVTRIRLLRLQNPSERAPRKKPRRS